MQCIKLTSCRARPAVASDFGQGGSNDERYTAANVQHAKLCCTVVNKVCLVNVLFVRARAI